MERGVRDWRVGGLENWSNGVLGYWSNGTMGNYKSKSAHTIGALRKFLFPLGVLLVLGCVTLSQATEVRLFDVANKKEMKLSEALQGLQGKKIVLVGEQHDRKGHHEAQLEIIKALHRSGTPVAIGLEMFRTSSQDALDQWVNGRLSEKEFQKVYYGNWGFPWALYSMIFEFAREVKIPMVGLNVPRAVTQQVARKGFNSLSPEQKGNLPFVECVVDPEYMEFVKRAHGSNAHAQMNFNYFCEAQLVWDMAMAIHALRFLDAHPGSMMVILAGSGHAWKKAIPEQISQRSPFPYTVILPEVPDEIDRVRVNLGDADYLMLEISDK
jgi:uncharacterized iron-regulated protein